MIIIITITIIIITIIIMIIRITTINHYETTITTVCPRRGGGIDSETCQVAGLSPTNSAGIWLSRIDGLHGKNKGIL